MEITFASMGVFGEVLLHIQEALLNSSVSPTDNALPSLFSLISILLLILTFFSVFKRTA